ncbi:MAG TPA: FMN reductase [Acidimicrobiia bacterium]|nr:FMN reductase [Acidimicrobiia bacterium]
MKQRRLAVVSGGLNEPSSTRLLADRLATAATQALADLDVEAEVDVVDLRDHAHELTNMLLTGFAGPELATVIEKVVKADGLIAATPIFSASYSGLFKTFFDILETDALAGTPALIAATAGTARHSLALEHVVRPLFSYLHAVVVPTTVFAASEDWGAGSSAGEALSERIDRAARELARLVASDHRPAAVDPYDDVTSFEDLLGG